MHVYIVGYLDICSFSYRCRCIADVVVVVAFIIVVAVVVVVLHRVY